MNNISNLNVNHVMNEKHLAKSIARSSKFNRYILDLNSEQFSYNYAGFPKKIKKIRRKKKWKKRFKIKSKRLPKKPKMFFNKETFNYFKRRKSDLKFLFLRNVTKTKNQNIKIF